MKEVLMFYMENCPYCRKAVEIEQELILSDPKYKDIVIRRVDEVLNPEFADKFNYYYVPTYYVDGKKIHEGAAAAADIKKVFNAAL